jgi:hypothetical protein
MQIEASHLDADAGLAPMSPLRIVSTRVMSVSHCILLVAVLLLISCQSEVRGSLALSKKGSRT